MHAGYAARSTELRHGIRVEVVTVIWMVIEATVAIGVGIAHHSTALQAFGIDSVIELVSGGVLLWRLVVEQRARRQHETAVERRIAIVERRASAITGWALYALAVYIVLDVALGLVSRNRADVTPWGIGLALAATVIMPVLWKVKSRIAARIGSAALRADAACSIVCAYMSLALLAGLALNALFGWWWADPLAALVLLYFIIHEGHEALESAAGRDTCSCSGGD